MKQQIELDVVEDIFGNEVATVETNPPSDFVPPIQTVIPFATDDQAAFETPFILMRADASPNSTPRISTLARRGPGNFPTEYEVVRRTGNPPAGAYTSTDFVRAAFCTVGELRNNESGPVSGNGGLSIQVDPIGGESLDGLIEDHGYPSIGNWKGVAVISPGLATEEWVIFDSVVDDLTGIRLENVYRACMDTFWKEHTAGDRIWFIWTGGLGMGSETYPLGTGVEVKLLPRSPNDEVLEAAATALPVIDIPNDTAERNSKPLLPARVSFEAGEWPATNDFDGTVVPITPPNYQGNRLLMTQRLWRTQDILWSVQGLDIGGSGLEPDEISAETWDVSVWIHDLDTDPTAQRANAVFEILNQVIGTGSDEFKIPKADLIAGGVTGLQFNARLEIEARHSPTGQPANQISYEAGFFDFLATGVFSLEADQVVLGSQFNGNDGDTDIVDELAKPTRFVGNAEIDTASFVSGGGSLIFDGTGDAVWMTSPRGFDWYDGEFTIDFRARFDDIVSAQTLIGQSWASGRRTWYLHWNGASFFLLFSRTGSNGPFSNIALGAFAPVAATWYNFRIVQKKDPSSPRFSMYVDGTRIGTTFTAQSHIRAGTDWCLGARYDGAGVYSEEFTGQIDSLEVRAFSVIDPNDTSYTVEVPALRGTGPAGAKDVLLANFEDVDASTTHRTDDTTRHDLTFGATTEIDTAQFKFGTSSLRCDGVNSLTPASADGVWLPDTLNPGNPRKIWELAKKDWTMEAHVRFNALPSTNVDGMAVLSKYNRPSGNRTEWVFWFNSDTSVGFAYYPTGNISSGVSTAGTIPVVSTGVWYHVAVQRVGDNLEILFEGNRVLNSAGFFAGNAFPNQTQVPVAIGRLYDANVTTRIRAFNGWLDGVRVHVGANLYSGATYTIPTVAPQVGDAGDRDILLLHHFDGADFFATDRLQETDDQTRGTRITFESGARYLDADPKFGVTHGEMDDTDAFNFTQSPAGWWDLADDDFTIDIWFYADDDEAGQNNGGVAYFNHWNRTSDQRGWRFAWDNGTGELEFVWTTNGTAADERRAFVSGLTFDTEFPENTWVHVAVERQGSTLSIYIDGTIQTLDGASDSIGSDVIFNPLDQPIRVGQEDEPNDKSSDSFWDEFRIVKRAEYGAASFTVETAAYPDPASPNL